MFKKFFQKFSKKKKFDPHYERKKEFFKGDTPAFFPEETIVENVSRERPSENVEKKAVFNEIDVLVNGEKISSYRVSDEGISVGRDPSKVGIIIAEPIISKLHCSFYRAGNNLKIIDHNSTNGIYHNGIKINDQILEDGAVISLGKKGTVRLVVHNIKIL
ncbi:MAG: FHA domain-containing protein [Candidatus Aminicenantes bacterium]|nr:FHA domain-containing protein [Candidatus Aminicenantes bacterium]